MTEVKEAAGINASAPAVTGRMSVYDHEQVVFCQDKATGLKAIIAIHNTVLGPAVGGTRMWAYSTEADALTDVLRLSRGMSYKSALAGLNIGGGKAVIIGDSRKDKNEALMRRFGRFVDSLGGRYITAEDVGISVKDMEFVKMETEHVVGLPKYMNGGGDPSPFTAYGVYMGMKASVKQQTGSDSLEGKKILVQGVGHVGEYLVGYLAKENARIMITDIYEDRLKSVSGKHKVEVVSPDAVYSQEMDIYSPCALGATVNSETIPQLTAGIICGAANNQLAEEQVHGQALVDKGILYAPDYLVNAGGIINCYWEIIGYNEEAVMAQCENIYDTTMAIYKLSAEDQIPSYLAANRLAEKRIETVGRVKLPY